MEARLAEAADTARARVGAAWEDEGMATDAPPLVDVRDIIRLVGQAAFERGRAYSKGGAVTDIDWDPSFGMLSSSVAGSGDNVYRCHIVIAPARDGYHKPSSGSCSCPIGGDCKHVAATIMACNSAHLQEFGNGTIVRGSDLKPEPVAVKPPDWKTALGSLSSAAKPPAASAGHLPATETPIALQFELREQTPRTRDRWRGPTAQTATGWKSQAEHRLAVRPATLSNAGNWVRGSLTWNSLGYQHRLNLNAEHQRWFSQFVALYRATTRDVYLGQDTDWLYLDEFHSDLLWRLLDEAAVLGIPLIGSKKEGIVNVGEAARVGLDLSARSLEGESTPGEHPGDLTLRTVLDIDGEAHAPEHAGSIGTHGVYTVEFTPSPVHTLAPTVLPLTEEHRRLLGARSALEIPAADVDEFLTAYYPQLSRAVELTSTDASVALPEILPPMLLLTATFGKKRSLKLEWAWEYRVGTAVTRMPLHPLGAAAPVSDSAGRDSEGERMTLGAVARVLAGGPVTAPVSTTLQDLSAAEFTATVLPVLEELPGVIVDVVGERPDYQELTDTPKLVVTTVATDKRDWFDLGVLVSVDGRKVPFGPLFKALSKGAKKLLLVDNSYLSLDQPVFDELKRLIDEATDLAEWETGPRISRYQSALWSEFEDLADETEQAQSWRDAVSGLADIENVEATPLPRALDASLRPYQLDGYHWLAFLYRHGLGGVLADDMGLGKTLQTLALIGHAVESRVADPITAKEPARPFLVVAPTSVVSNWVAEATRFVPGLTVRGITATEAKSREPISVTAAGADIVVTSYALFRLNFESYQAFGQNIGWAGLVLDEAQFVKNASSIAHRCAVDLIAPFKLAITGTPMENSLEDLWSLFAITAPGLFPSARRFAEEYVRPIGLGDGEGTVAPAGVDSRTSGGVQFEDLNDASAARHSSGTVKPGTGRGKARAGNYSTVSAEIEPTGMTAAQLVAKLRRRIRPLMMRRTKELVAKDLPAKQEQVLQIDLAPAHRALYDTFLQKERQKLLGLIEDMNKNRFVVFRSLTLLRMLSLDASLVDEKYSDIPSSKLDALFEQLEDVVDEGHRALIFSQFTSFLGKAAERLEANGIPYAYLDGSTTKRADVINRFKTGDAPVFLISLKAGGFGLNLTEADYVFLLDPWWNPATETQAVDRTHRIGQTKNVMVYRMVARGTIEEKVMALKERKAKLFNAVMDDDAIFSSALTADDIRGLLDA